jgi:integrase
MGATAIVEATRDLDVPRLSPRTRQRHFNALSSLWQDALRAGQVTENIFAGFRFASTRRPQDQRAMWSSELLARLFNTPVWRGCRSPERRSTPGDMVIRDARFWLPLMALFSGMRLEEICQLQVEDVRREEGVWVFDVNARGPRQVKNQSSVRLVPIHRELLTIGFLEYVEEVRRLNSVLVFPELRPGGADGKLGHNFTKWFTRYRKAVGVYEERLDFHSFRHSASTFLLKAKVPVAVVDSLTGHVTPGETTRYNKGFAIEHLKESIDQLSPKIDLTFLHSR